MGKLLIVKTGSTVPDILARKRDFDTWIVTAMGWAGRPARVVAVNLDDELPPIEELDEIAGVVITGSPEKVSDRAPWSERTATWLSQVAETDTPMLGICYGHQLIAHALGGVVADNPNGRQIGTMDIDLTDAGKQDPLFRGIGDVLHIPVSHVQSVITLPADARLLATTAGDPHHAFAIGEHIWGLQCHPEFDASIVRGYIHARRDIISAEGLDPESLSLATEDSADGTLLLRRFAEQLDA